MTEVPTSTADDPADERIPDEPVDESTSGATPAEPDTAATAPGAEPEPVSVGSPPRRKRRMGNPVVWREMHTRFNSFGTAAVIVIFIALLGLPAVAVYASRLDNDYALLNLGGNGIYLFEVTLLLMMGLVLLIAPLQAAGSIAMERDRQTLMPMQISLLRPWQIALGKVRVATTFTMYLFFLGAPILAIAWGVGSVSISHLVAGLLLLLVTIVFATTVTVFCSSLTKRSIGAAFIAYVALGAMILGPTVGFYAWHIVDAQRGDDAVRAPKVMLATNPFMALATAVGTPVQRGDDLLIEFDRFGDPTGGGEPPLSGLRDRLATEQDGVLGAGSDSRFGGPDGTVVFEGDVMFDENGNPMFDDFGNPIPAGAEIVVDEDGNSIVLGQDGQPIATIAPAAEETAGDSGSAVASSEAIASDVATTTVPPIEEGDGVLPAVTVVGSINETTGEAAQQGPPGIPGIPLWFEYIVFVIAISALAVWGTTRRLRTPASTER